MKHILLAVFIVLSLATAGWAGEPNYDSTTEPLSSDHGIVYCLDPINPKKGPCKKWYTDLTPDCLAAMEEAMRAMEPWIGMDLKRTQSGGWVFTYPVEPDEKKRNALRLWADATRCWSH